MPYYNVIPHTLYQSCMSSAWEYSGGDDSVTRARAWVEAENIYAVWKLVQTWSDMMNSGEVENRFPDPYWDDEKHSDKAVLTQELADLFIEEMDADFQLEKDRFQGGAAPDFARLSPFQRMAFVQECYPIIKTAAQINKEADERLAAGEALPPPVKPKSR